jgi:hypothetical protein
MNTSHKRKTNIADLTIKLENFVPAKVYSVMDMKICVEVFFL